MLQFLQMNWDSVLKLYCMVCLSVLLSFFSFNSSCKISIPSAVALSCGHNCSLSQQPTLAENHKRLYLREAGLQFFGNIGSALQYLAPLWWKDCTVNILLSRKCFLFLSWKMSHILNLWGEASLDGDRFTWFSKHTEDQNYQKAI